MDLLLLDDGATPEQLRDRVKAVLNAAGVEFLVSSEAGGNPLQRATKASAVVAIDSHLDRQGAMRFGWSMRGTPAIIVRDLSGNPLLTHPGYDNDVRIITYDPTDVSGFESKLSETVADLTREPDRYRSFLVRESSSAIPDGRQVFISYSHADREFVDRLLVHLAPLQREGRVTAWSDDLIRPGSDWRAEIENALGRAGIAVLLASPDFLASEFVTTEELPRLLSAAKVGGTRILPVVVRPCRYTRDPSLSRFQAFNAAAPIGTLAPVEQDAAWDKVSIEIERCVDDSVSR